MDAPERQLRRMLMIDEALSSPDGLSVADMARRMQVNPKTVRRALQGVRSLGLSLKQSPDVAAATAGARRYFYADRRRRMFTNAMITLARETTPAKPARPARHRK